MTKCKSYFGKYRGKVENNVDPMQLGRLQVSCPAVLGEGKLSWAMPSSPFAGPGVGLFILPPKKANVWVEFEGGDVDYPIWSGCFWDLRDVPASPAMEHMKVLKTDSVTLTINDMKSTGALTLVVDSPAVSNTIKLVCDSNGVLLTIGDAKLNMTIEKIETKFAEDASTFLSAEKLELIGKEQTVTLDEKGIKMIGAEHTITFSESGIEAVASKSTVSLTEGSAKMSNDKASVDAAADTVTVNDGALEVK